MTPETRVNIYYKGTPFSKLEVGPILRILSLMYVGLPAQGTLPLHLLKNHMIITITFEEIPSKAFIQCYASSAKFLCAPIFASGGIFCSGFSYGSRKLSVR